MRHFIVFVVEEVAAEEVAIEEEVVEEVVEEEVKVPTFGLFAKILSLFTFRG